MRLGVISPDQGEPTAEARLSGGRLLPRLTGRPVCGRKREPKRRRRLADCESWLDDLEDLLGRIRGSTHEQPTFFPLVDFVSKIELMKWVATGSALTTSLALALPCRKHW